eukprot:scaffold6570_cov51-Attheya_sp.AAC.5
MDRKGCLVRVGDKGITRWARRQGCKKECRQGSYMSLPARLTTCCMQRSSDAMRRVVRIFAPPEKSFE